MIHGKDVPVFTGNLMQLLVDAASFSTVAESIRTTGSDIHTGFQGLKSFYEAPEAEQLFATTAPVRDTADDFAGELETIGTALTTYEEEIRPLVQKLTLLAGQARAFEAENSGDDDWQKDHDKVDEHQAIWDGVAAAVAAFQAAERRAHNAISALHGGVRLEVNDGSKKPNAYGWREEDLAHSEKLPWGKPEQKKYDWYHPHTLKSAVWDGFIVDGVWGTVNGLLTLAGVHGWDEAKAAWKGLAQLGIGITLYTVPGLRDIPDDQLPGWMRNSKAVTREVGKSLIAYDEWKSGDKSRAAGVTVFNIGTIIAAPAKAGQAANAASKTITAVNAVRQGGRLIDPMTYVTKAVSKTGEVAKIRIPDVIAGLKNVYAGSYARLPDGSLRFPDGTMVYADNTVVLPDGTAYSQGGHYAADGSQLQPAKEAPHEGTAAERSSHNAVDDRQPVPANTGHVGHPPVDLGGTSRGHDRFDPRGTSDPGVRDGLPGERATDGDVQVPHGERSPGGHTWDDAPSSEAGAPYVDAALIDEIFPDETPRGINDPLPPADEIKQALRDRRLTMSPRTYSQDDGHFYATRVFSGGRADGETVLAGHGYLRRDSGELTVPEGTTISFYVSDGELIPGLNGVAVESGVYPESGYVETFKAGDRIPDYTLAAPEAAFGRSFSVMEDSVTVAERTLLSELLKPNMGNVHWAACREHML